MKRARVCWRSLASGASGHGEWLDERLAELWLAEARQRCAGMPITHWLEYENANTPATAGKGE